MRSIDMCNIDVTVLNSCLNCKQSNPNAVFCCDACKDSYYEKKRQSLNPKIIEARISHEIHNMRDFLEKGKPRIEAILSDDKDKWHKIAEYYPDEVSFHPAEFVGLTINEVRQLHFQRDKEYLQS